MVFTSETTVTEIDDLTDLADLAEMALPALAKMANWYGTRGVKPVGGPRWRQVLGVRAAPYWKPKPAASTATGSWLG